MNNQKNNRDRDTGLAVTLIWMLAVQFTGIRPLLWPAIITLLLVMTAPVVFRPLTAVWFGLSEILGTLFSKVLLTLLFHTIVTPMGLFRRIIGRDSMQHRQWQSDRASVFIVRNHRYGRRDLEKPY